MQKLKINDEVLVRSGRDKGKRGLILKLDYKNGRVLVKGVNLRKKAMRPSQANPNGGFVEAERSVAISTVGIVSPKSQKAGRVKIASQSGKKVIVLVKCGSALK